MYRINGNVPEVNNVLILCTRGSGQFERKLAMVSEAWFLRVMKSNNL